MLNPLVKGLISASPVFHVGPRHFKLYLQSKFHKGRKSNANKEIYYFVADAETKDGHCDDYIYIHFYIEGYVITMLSITS